MASKDEHKEFTETVAQHYNKLQESGLKERVKSRIFYLRNFNNWIKSMAIGDALYKIRKSKGSNSPIVVLDLCSGKGGDLLKWKKGRISKLVCADIAGTSVEQCEVRYKEMMERGQRERFHQDTFTAEFITADCTKVRLKEKYKDPSIQFDLVSCQFSYHYSFESLQQAELMLKNACECLKPGGYFIGTTPNSYEIVKRLRASESMKFGNEVYSIEFKTEDKENMPLFGAQYDFHLEEVVDCPEFLVYFPLLEKMAEKYHMKLEFATPFAKFFEQQIATNDGRGLIGRMQALEPYPPATDVDLLSQDKQAYLHAHSHVENMKKQEGEQERRRPPVVGTMSQSEWEAATIYLVFAFRKLVREEKNENVSEDSTVAESRKRSQDEDSPEEDSSKKQLKTEESGEESQT